MALPTKPPGGGGQTPRVHFTYVGTAKGARWNAWCAGPCHWFDCHTKGRTKPCLAAISGGALDCPRCTPLDPIDEIGYQPLYREIDARPVMVIVHEHSREQVDSLALHNRVLVGREEEASAAVWITHALKRTPLYTSSLPYLMRPADLTETLLRVWNLPVLTEWYRKNVPQTAPAPTVKVKPKKSDGKPFGPMTEKAAEKYSARDTDGQVQEEYDVIRERLKANAGNLKPSTNGNHE